MKHQIINHLLIRWMYFLREYKIFNKLMILWKPSTSFSFTISPSNISSFACQWTLLQIFITIFICNTPLLDKHHKIILCVILFEPYNCPFCDLVFRILHNTSAMYLTMVPSVSTYLPIWVVFYSPSFLMSSSKFPIVPCIYECIFNFLPLSLITTWVLFWLEHASHSILV